MNNTVDKNESSYDPSFSIDSTNAEKLDMYGVWIKKKPANPHTDFSQPGTETDNGDDTMKNIDDTFSLADDMEELDDFSFPETDNSDADSDEHDDIIAFDELGTLDSDDEFMSLDSFDDFDDVAELPASEESSDSGVLEEDSFESLDLDDFLDEDESDTVSDHSAASDSVSEPIEFDFSSMQDEHEELEEVPPGTSVADLENFDEISLDDFEDMDDTFDSEESIEEFEDVLDDPEAKNFAAVKMDKGLDLDVTEDENIKNQDDTDISDQSDDERDISIFDTDAASQEVNQTEVFFDDVKAVEKDLLSENASAQAKSPEAAQNTEVVKDKSTELLMQIAHGISGLNTSLSGLSGLAGSLNGINNSLTGLKEELNSLSGLKAELTSLKESISTKLAAPEAGQPVHEESHAEPSESQELETEESTGFFSDDDTDETIALTGDELNNILITADFTSEKGVDEEQDSYEIPEVLTEDIVPGIAKGETADIDFEESISEDMFKSDEAEQEEFGEQIDFETEGEKLLAAEPMFNVEALPITALPDDLSYLDDNEAIDPSEELPALEGVNNASDTFDSQLLDSNNLAELTIEEFSVPDEQEIQIPSSSAKSAELVDEDNTPVIHELFTDNDIPELAAEDSDTTEGDEAFMGTFDIPDLRSEDDLFDTDQIPELSEADEIDTDKPQTEQKQETLLKAATQIKEEQEKTVSIPLELKNEIKSVLAYMDQLLEALPEKKIEEFAKSEYFETYKHLFEELGIS